MTTEVFQASHSTPKQKLAPPRSVYIHIPFCPYKCPYCDFVTHVGSYRLVEPYVQALIREISQLDPEGTGPSLETIYFGGGTPSILKPMQVEAILGALDRRLGLESTAEISLEANPDAVDLEKLRGFRAAGVNRLSFGVQSFQPTELRALGRRHTHDEVRQSFSAARDAGFENLSIDLIYGVQHQTLASWRETLREAVALSPDHLSMYSLIVEPGTTYGRLYDARRLVLPDDDIVADMYDLACDQMRDHGFDHYEVANWSRAGAECLHNLTYWRNQQFYALGVGAHDYLKPFRSVRVHSVRRYIDILQAGSSPIQEREFVGPEDERFETVVMGLRLLREGQCRRAYELRFGEPLEHQYDKVVDELKALGLIEDDGCCLLIPEMKVPLANEIWERFLPSTQLA